MYFPTINLSTLQIQIVPKKSKENVYKHAPINVIVMFTYSNVITIILLYTHVLQFSIISTISDNQIKYKRAKIII